MTAVRLSRCQGAPLSMKPDLPHARNHYFDTHSKLFFMFLCPLNPDVFAMDVHTYPYVCIAVTYSIPVFTNLVHLSLICHSPTLFYLLHFVCARSQVMSVVFHSWTGAWYVPTMQCPPFSSRCVSRHLIFGVSHLLSFRLHGLQRAVPAPWLASCLSQQQPPVLAVHLLCLF